MTPSQRGRRGTLAAAAAAVLAVVGVLALVFGLRGQQGPPPPDAAPTSSATSAEAGPAVTTAPTTTPAGTPTATPSDPNVGSRIGPFLPGSAPTRLDIPSIGVSSTRFVDLGIAADGTITVPGSADEVGFYTDGPTPGQLGPAVLAAHVDSKQGPGIFYRLGAVKPGDVVKVGRADGSTTTFRVDKVASYPKDRFPTEEVYRGDFTRAEIRLVTCGGPFDAVKHYLDNVVVFGHLEA
ncbi:MAG TPA: class F sortase [Lapillicoccus sp.]|nr:class F sortase [Lapillicoccus sp.]